MRSLIAFFVVVLPLASGAGTSIDLADLNIGSDRIPPWYPAFEAEAGYFAAQSWPEYDATCANAPCPSGKSGFRDAPGNPMSSCSAANPSSGNEDVQELQCMISNAPNSSVIYLPPGTYDMGNSLGEVLKFERSHVVLRGASATNTILRSKERQDKVEPTTGTANCRDSDYPAGENCRATVIAIGSQAEGSRVDWTGGFKEEATVVTVSSSSSFRVGSWLVLEINDAVNKCPSYFPEPVPNARNMAHALSHYARITAINGSQITIDHGLRMDYTNDSSCAASGRARPWDPITQIGIERVQITSDPGLAQTDLRDLAPVTFGHGTAESWFVGNDVHRSEDIIIYMVGSSRNWVQGNKFHNYGHINAGFNTGGVTFDSRSNENVVENNAIYDYVTGSQAGRGTQGNVFSYNYMRFGNSPRGNERAYFNHGLYTREILLEGNDVDGELMTADHWWGSNGPRITAFRNRIVGTGTQAILANNRDKPGNWIIADRINWIGNNAQFFLMSPPCFSGFPGCLGSAGDFDGSNGPEVVTNMWVERNRFRDTSTCSSDPSSGRCGFHVDTPRSDTSCGTRPGDCGSGVGTNGGGSKAPSTWANDRIPHSLYRASSEPPSWWCQEACSWSDVHSGIGAWGDDHNGSLCKLPAQILHDRGTCTPIGSATATPPDPTPTPPPPEPTPPPPEPTPPPPAPTPPVAPLQLP